MLTVACVKVAPRYKDEHVVKLRNMIARHLPQEHEFICLSDTAIDGVEVFRIEGKNLPGWWAKLELFKLGRPLLYFDLDTVIVSDLTRLADWDGFGIMKDPWVPGYGSAVMRLTGNEAHVFEDFHPSVMKLLRGDQDWLNVALPNAPTFPVHWVPSFKAHNCVDGPPEGAMVVNFHGFPKPWQISKGWVPEYWR